MKKVKFDATRRATLIGLGASLLPLAATSESIDRGPMRFIVITAAGGAADQIARLVASKLSTATGRSVVVENKAGAGGNIATEFVARAPADGKTFLFTSNNHTINPFIYKDAGYLSDDLVPVIQVGAGPSVMAVHPSVPAHTVQELIALSHSQQLSYASTGLGSASNLACEMIKASSGMNMVHVPYKGGAEAITAVLGAQVPVIMTSLTSAGPHIKKGTLRALCVSTAQRWPGNPEIPSIAEAGFRDCTYEVWQGILAPKGTPTAVVEKANADIARILGSSEVHERLVTIGYRPVGKPTGDFAHVLSDDRERVGALVKKIGLTVG